MLLPLGESTDKRIEGDKGGTEDVRFGGRSGDIFKYIWVKWKNCRIDLTFPLLFLLRDDGATTREHHQPLFS